MARTGKYILRSIDVDLPKNTDSKGGKGKKWPVVLAIILLLCFLAVLAIVLILRMYSNDDSGQEISTTSATTTTTTTTTTATIVQSTPIIVYDQNQTVDSSSFQTITTRGAWTTTKDVSHESSTAATTEIQTISTTAADQGSTFGLQTTTGVQSTPHYLSDQNTTIGSRGKAFVVLFMKTYELSINRIYITSDSGVQINVSTSENLDSTLKNQIDKMINISSSQLVTIPGAMELNNFQTEVKSIIIESSQDIFVTSNTDEPGTSGSTTHIPLNKLSAEYVVVSTEPTLFTSQFAVAAIADNTWISITFKMRRNLPLYISGNAFYNNNVFNITLHRFETYQIAHSTDLTGTVIKSSSPIAAFSGNDCNKLEYIGYCDHLIEQLPPTVSVDNTYIVPPNSDDRDTLIRITALENCSFTYSVGNVNQTVSLHQYDTFDTKISDNQTCSIESKKPVLVTTFGLRSKSFNLGDPSMIIVPGVNQYLNYYKIVVPSDYANSYVSILMKYSSKDFLQINNTEIRREDIVFESNLYANTFTYNVRVIKVSEGELTASTVDGERFGLICNGVGSVKAYGFSGNSLIP
ncbi:IgGFc-binding protein-like isoform X2 [Crassostrea virginica]